MANGSYTAWKMVISGIPHLRMLSFLFSDHVYQQSRTGYVVLGYKVCRGHQNVGRTSHCAWGLVCLPSRLEGWTSRNFDRKLSKQMQSSTQRKEKLPSSLPPRRKKNTSWRAALLKGDRACRQTGTRTLASGVPNSREGQQDPGKYEESRDVCIHH